MTYKVCKYNHFLFTEPDKMTFGSLFISTYKFLTQLIVASQRGKRIKEQGRTEKIMLYLK